MPRVPFTTPSPALAVALIALFVALGGSGYAAVTLNGDQIKNRSIAGEKLKRNTITATEISESKLDKVRARAAQGTTTARRFSFVEGSNTGFQQIMSLDGVVIRARCQSNDLDVSIRVSPSGPGLLQSASTDTTDTGRTAFNETLRAVPVEEVNILPVRDNNQIGHTEVTRENGTQVSIDWQADNGGPGAIDDCMFAGNAVRGSAP
jgi:hypothetical protein